MPIAITAALTDIFLIAKAGADLELMRDAVLVALLVVGVDKAVAELEAEAVGCDGGTRMRQFR